MVQQSDDHGRGYISATPKSATQRAPSGIGTCGKAAVVVVVVLLVMDKRP